MSARPEFDERDNQIRKVRSAAFDKIQGPRCGDFIKFRDGVTRRISHVWEFQPRTVQTSDGGSWHLGEGWTPDEAYVSFSGSLYRSVPADSVILSDEIREGRV